MAQAKLISKRPPGGSPQTWEFPSFTRTRLDSGLHVLAAHVPGRTLAAARLILEAGATNEPDRQAGAAHIAARALTEGTDRYKGPAFTRAVEQLGADIDASCDWDSFRVDLRVPMNRMEPALELLAEAVLRPEFSGREVERLRQERVASIMQEYANAATRANIAFDKMVFSPDSLYSRSDQGDYWSVFQLGKGKVKKYYEAFATPESAALVVAGDLDGFPLAKIAEKLFGKWKAKEPQRPRPVIREGINRTSVLIVDREESKQSQLRVGHMGLPRATPDFFPAIVMGIALGGTFNSRLNRRLREEKGYTYGAGAGFDFRREAGPFTASTSADTDATLDTISEIIDVVRTMHAEGLTKDELELAKGFLKGVFPLRFETPEAIVSGISSLITYGLPEDYFATYRDSVEGVTLDEASQAAADHLRPEQLAIVVVGDTEKIRDPILGADFGPVATIEDSEPGQPPAN